MLQDVKVQRRRGLSHVSSFKRFGSVHELENLRKDWTLDETWRSSELRKHGNNLRTVEFLSGPDKFSFNSHTLSSDPFSLAEAPRLLRNPIVLLDWSSCLRLCLGLKRE